MVNHVRTLLLNAAAGAFQNVPGEEYVPPEFRPRVESRAVSKVRSILFGTDPDRYMLNYRLRQLMPVLHDSEFSEHVLRHDRRITYWPVTDLSLYKNAFGTKVVEITNTASTLTPIGVLEPHETTGRIFHQWKVEVLNSSTVRVSRLTAPKQSQNFQYTMTNGISSQVPFVGTTLLFNFSAPSGVSWYVESLARPKRNIADLYVILRDTLNDEDEADLFDGSESEPGLTYVKVWRQHPFSLYRMAGLLLATADRLHVAAEKQ